MVEGEGRVRDIHGKGAPDEPPEEGGWVHRTDRGELRMWLAAPTVMIFKYRGHSDAGYVDWLAQVFDEVFGDRDGLHVFVDCEEQTGYDAEFRQRIAEWGNRILPRTLTYCLLVRSRLVAFGITVATMLVGKPVTVVGDRASYRATLNAALRRSA